MFITKQVINQVLIQIAKDLIKNQVMLEMLFLNAEFDQQQGGYNFNLFASIIE